MGLPITLITHLVLVYKLTKLYDVTQVTSRRIESLDKILLGERAGMRRWEKAMTLQVEGGDELPNRSIRVIVPVMHDRRKRELEGDDM